MVNVTKLFAGLGLLLTMDATPDGFFTITSAARRIGVCRLTLRRACRRLGIEPVRLFGLALLSPTDVTALRREVGRRKARGAA